MNRAERRAAARRMLPRSGNSAESTRRVRSKLATAMKGPLEEQEVLGTKPHVQLISEDAAITESGLFVPAKTGEGLIVP